MYRDMLNMFDMAELIKPLDPIKIAIYCDEDKRCMIEETVSNLKIKDKINSSCYDIDPDKTVNIIIWDKSSKDVPDDYFICGIFDNEKIGKELKCHMNISNADHSNLSRAFINIIRMLINTQMNMFIV